MHRKGRYWPGVALVLVGVMVCVGCCRRRPGANDAAQGSAVAEQQAEPPDEPAVSAPKPEETTAAAESADEKGPDDEASDPEPQPPGGPERLTEERFIDMSVKIRVWQNAIADTPEGRQKLDELVLALLDSEGLTRADLAAFGETLGEEDVQRIDEEIDERVAELGGRRFQVEPRPTEGSKIIEDDADADGSDD
ncbi:MAG: hypothetical protein ACE5JM_16630 [Armatimonadota bacterium]